MAVWPVQFLQGWAMCFVWINKQRWCYDLPTLFLMLYLKLYDLHWPLSFDLITYLVYSISYIHLFNNSLKLLNACPFISLRKYWPDNLLLTSLSTFTEWPILSCLFVSFEISKKIYLIQFAHSVPAASLFAQRH